MGGARSSRHTHGCRLHGRAAVNPRGTALPSETPWSRCSIRYKGVNAVDQAGGPTPYQGEDRSVVAGDRSRRSAHLRAGGRFSSGVFSPAPGRADRRALKAPGTLSVRSVSDRGTTQTESGSGDLAVDLGAGNDRDACFARSMRARDRRDTGARGKLSRGENTVVKRENCAQVTKRLKIARKGTP